MKITVYGVGYVGLVTACCFAECGHEVLCVEKDVNKLAMLKQGECPIYEPGLQELMLRGIKNARLHFTDDYDEGLAFAIPQFIAVGTPSKPSGAVDLTYVEQVVKELANRIDDYRVIITKSTVPVGSSALIKRWIKESLEKRSCNINFAVVSNPEFLREGNAIKDFLHPDRVVIGCESEREITLMNSIYQSLSCPIISVTPMSAELAKYTANALLATKISFMNEISHIAEGYGADIQEIKQAIALDRRIGPYFIDAGCGYGGSCFPKDVSALISSADKIDYYPELICATQNVNKKQKSVLWDKLTSFFNLDYLRNKTIAIWGLAFKPNTDDVRESPSIELVKRLISENVSVNVYDPVAMPNFKTLFFDENEKINYTNTAVDALRGADALMIVTDWTEFQEIDPSVFVKTMNQAIVFDGRNIFSLEKMRQYNIKYFGVGRSTQSNNSAMSPTENDA